MKISPLLLFSLVLGFPCHLPAQSGGDFHLTWSTLDGGGGASRGGTFNLAGTVGQPEAGAVNFQAPFRLTAGYWSFLGVIQLPESPRLKILTVSAESALISWPASAKGFELESTDNPAMGNWTTVPAPIEVSGDENTLLVACKGVRFYRLRRQ